MGEKRNYTMTEKALEQRRAASKLSTGPITEEGKAASSRNNWKHGLRSRAHLAWQSIGLGIIGRPCRTTCERYPCSLVEEGHTREGGDCLDKTVYLETFDAVMSVLHSGDGDHAYGLFASQLAQATDLLSDLRRHVADHGVVLEEPMTDKEGNIVGYKYIANPSLAHYNKLLQNLGINFPEMMATPRAIAQLKEKEEERDLFGEMMDRIATAQSGKRFPRTFEGEADE